MHKLLLFVFVFLIAGCSTTSAQTRATPKKIQLPDLLKSPTEIFIGWVKTADSNFHLAVDNGDLKSTDPIIPCFDALVGTQNPNAKPYDTSNLGGVASVTYIRVNSLQSNLATTQTSCDALTGKFFRDMIRNAPFNPARILTP